MGKAINSTIKGICLIVVLVSILIIGIFFGVGTYIASNDARHSYQTTDVSSTPHFIAAPTTIPDLTPKIKPIDILLADIIKDNVANKSHYTMVGGSKDVHICGNMACEQAEWIAKNYGFETGIVLLWNNGQDDNHAQTWVIIDDDRYIFESTFDTYWTESDHRNRFGGSNRIRFVSIKKGREHAKSSSELYRCG